MSVTEYLYHQEMRRNTLFRIVDGMGHYIIDGEEIPMKIFERMFPMPLYVRQEKLNWKGNNIDKTKDWME